MGLWFFPSFWKCSNWLLCEVKVLVTQSCLTLCNPRDCSSPGTSFHKDFSGKNTEVGCHALLQGFLLTQGPNPDLSHCRQILYCLSYHLLCMHNINTLHIPILSISNSLFSFPTIQSSANKQKNTSFGVWCFPVWHFTRRTKILQMLLDVM